MNKAVIAARMGGTTFRKPQSRGIKMPQIGNALCLQSRPSKNSIQVTSELCHGIAGQAEASSSCPQ